MKVSLVRRFLLFTFAFSWGTHFLAHWLHRDAVIVHWGDTEFRIPLDQPFLFLGQLGPGLAALWLAGDREDADSLWMRFKNWRVDPSWYSIAFFLPLGVVGVAALAYTATGGFLRMFILLAPIAWVLFIRGLLLGPFWEEMGWRGFLLPALLQRWEPMRASLFIGLIWGVWHLPGYWNRPHGDSVRFLGYFLMFCISTMGLSVILTWLFLRTGTFLPAVVFHASYNFMAQTVTDQGLLLSGWGWRFFLFVIATVWAVAFLIHRLGGLRAPTLTSQP